MHVLQLGEVHVFIFIFIILKFLKILNLKK